MTSFDRIEFARQFTDFITAMEDEAESNQQAPFFRQTLLDHFGSDLAGLPVILELIQAYEHVNMQAALDRFIEKNQFKSQLLGFQTEHPFGHASISALLTPKSAYFEGPVRYQTLLVGSKRVTVYQDVLLLLTRNDGTRLALLISGPSRMDPRLALEVMAVTSEIAQQTLTTLRDDMLQNSAFRGKTLSLSQDDYRQVQIHVHDLPPVNREDIILQPGVLDQVDRLTVNFSTRATELKAAGRHIKRGLLLYGPPGTGKTYTAMYLASTMQDRTILLMTGLGMGMLESTVGLARTLAPSMVVLEDVDLIAQERSTQSGCSVPLLFELLNQMDGLAADVDIIFLLTTNRPEILEPALAARPGRIDQAIHVPLPDADCRRRLLDLYGKGLRVEVADMDSLVTRTEGASAAFIKELLRRAALYGNIVDGNITVCDSHFDEALQELLARGGQLTQSLLGFKGK